MDEMFPIYKAGGKIFCNVSKYTWFDVFVKIFVQEWMYIDSHINSNVYVNMHNILHILTITS